MPYQCAIHAIVIIDEGLPGADDVSAPGARVRTLVIEAREDLEMAAQVRATL